MLSTGRKKPRAAKHVKVASALPAHVESNRIDYKILLDNQCQVHIFSNDHLLKLRLLCHESSSTIRENGSNLAGSVATVRLKRSLNSQANSFKPCWSSSGP
jgi:hypothetical protein